MGRNERNITTRVKVPLLQTLIEEDLAAHNYQIIEEWIH